MKDVMYSEINLTAGDYYTINIANVATKWDLTPTVKNTIGTAQIDIKYPTSISYAESNAFGCPLNESSPCPMGHAPCIA